MFCLDIAMKCIAYGFLFAPEAYLGDPFNFIDVMNIIFNGVSYVPYPTRFVAYTAAPKVNIINGLRATRFIPRIPGLRLLFGTLFRTIPSVISIFSFTLVIFFIFAVIGVQQFRSRFASCTDTTVMNHAECVGFYWNDVGLFNSRVWMNQSTFHFDNFANAMFSLFVLSTTDNWINYFLHTAMDIPKVMNNNPKRNDSPAHALFFVVFIVIVNFLVMRMMVGFFIDQFGLTSGNKLLTERQRLWRDMNRIIQKMKPRRTPKAPKFFVRAQCHKFVHSNKFQTAMVLIILGNFAFTASQKYNSPLTYKINTIQATFVGIYIVEAIFKLIGNEVWNIMFLLHKFSYIR